MQWNNAYPQGSPNPTSDFASSELAALAEECEANGDFDASTEADARDFVMRVIAKRQGQPDFRKQLIRAYDGRCAVTECSVLEVLEAAHIKPFSKSGPNQTANGLLLRSDLHKLFDLGYLSVTPALAVEVSRHDDELSTIERIAEALNVSNGELLK